MSLLQEGGRPRSSAAAPQRRRPSDLNLTDEEGEALEKPTIIKEVELLIRCDRRSVNKAKIEMFSSDERWPRVRSLFPFIAKKKKML